MAQQDNRQEHVILEDVLVAFGQTKSYHVILLNDSGFLYRKLKVGISKTELNSLRIQEGSKVLFKDYAHYEQLEFNDIVGCQCMKDIEKLYANPASPVDSPPNQNNTLSFTKAYFCIYAYVLRKKRNSLTKSLKRHRVSLIMTVDHSNNFADNLALAEKWRDTIRKLLNGAKLNEDTGTLTCPIMPNKKLLIFVSPKSGSGKAFSIFKQRVAPVLAEAAISYDLIVTDRRNSARNYVRENNLDAWHGIVIVAGDGLIYEVVNGLAERSDWATAIKTPIGVVPGGSGNGLAHSIAHALDEPQDTNPILLSAFNIAKTRVTSMDLVLIQTRKESMYSFLSTGWGLMADIDIESEPLRALGEARFTLWAFGRIANLKTYRGRLSYLPAKENNGVGSSSDRQRNCQHSLNEQGCGSGDQTGERMTDNGDFRAEVLDVRAKEQTSVRPNDGRFDHRNHSLLVPLDQPVPSDWVQCEDDFIFIYFIYQTHLGEEMYCAPHANLNDGLIHLMAIRKGVTRSQLITFLLSLKTGAFEKLSFVELHTIRAFRLEPISSGSHIVVDGELVEYGPIQGEVMPSMARLIVH